MFRLAFFLTALYLSSAVAKPNFVQLIGKSVNDGVMVAVNEGQAIADPIGQTIAWIGGSACQSVKRLVGVNYDNYNNTEGPDMSHLTLVLMEWQKKTVIYNLAAAAEEIPKDNWFDKTLPLYVFMHGFTDNPNKNSFQTMHAAFREIEKCKGKVNLLALDASSMIKWFYLRSSTMVHFIGEKLGATLAAMIPAGLDPENIHLIGHSLGSHIAGFAGKQFYSLTGSKVGRISSLDPAGPCFTNLDESLRLSKDDAEFVDVIHTDAGVYGLRQSIGHVDFWPNNGEEQPGCLPQTCSHSRAWRIFAESVANPDAFMAVRCNSFDEFRHGECDYNDTSIMGFNTPTTTRGEYYCRTRNTEPFGMGEEGLTYENNGLIRTISFGAQDFFGKNNFNRSIN